MTTFLLIALSVSILFLAFRKKDKPSKPYKIDYEDEDLKPFPHVKKLTKEEILNRMEVVKQFDDFDDSVTIGFNHVGNEDSIYLPMYFDEEFGIVGNDHIGISFEIEGKDAFVVIYSNVKELPLNYCSITFMFENGPKEGLSFANKSEGGHIKYNKGILTGRELAIFSEYRLDKWKLVDVNGIKVWGDLSMISAASDIPDKDTSQVLIMRMARAIREAYSYPFEEV